MLPSPLKEKYPEVIVLLLFFGEINKFEFTIKTTN